jgi:transcriptional regulator with XRE-family HTH domain
MMLRGSYNEGFMAPSLAALYTSPRWTITAGAGDIDIYRNPALNEGPYVMRTDFGGNPDLDAQESKGDTFGFVIDVPFAPGLSVTADYWRIRRTNLLGQRSVAQINDSDAALLREFTQAQLAAGAGVTFQQIQKYERGVNRVSAARLLQIAAVLKSTGAALLGELDTAEGDDLVLAQPGVSELLSAFRAIGDGDKRDALLVVAKGLRG